MADIFLEYVRQTLPKELETCLGYSIAALETGDYATLLSSNEARVLFGHLQNETVQEIHLSDHPIWSDFIFRRLHVSLAKSAEKSSVAGPSPESTHMYFCIGLAALSAFLQSNFTGPPLPFSSADYLLTPDVTKDGYRVKEIRTQLVKSLSIDGEAAYRLIPNVELFCLAETIFTAPAISKGVKASSWARLRVDVVHQRLLSESAPALQTAILDRFNSVVEEISSSDSALKDRKAALLLERAMAYMQYGFDKKARADLDKAASLREFRFALTGRLGKRTKFQKVDTSQLVILARSISPLTQDGNDQTHRNGLDRNTDEKNEQSQPRNITLKDDTLLDAISFSNIPSSTTDITPDSSLPSELAELNPESQPLLDPLDSIILLGLATSIKNTSPEHGLTREETLPYATRVLEGGSSNWQIYTQALLIRSRIESYKSRTVERGLLQLQALVDQVIAETSEKDDSKTRNPDTTSFLPKPKDSDPAPAHERLKYVFQLASPSRWELESELAARWVNLGGLRSALDIYERLEMWPEAALCWAATEREEKARLIVRKQLFNSTNDGDIGEDNVANWKGSPKDPAPAEAPRLYCILGDLEDDPDMFEKAWEVSNKRYARAQRSLGRYWFTKKDYGKAAIAYVKSLQVNQLNHPAWFALGCCYLELSQFDRAVEAFTRTVQLDDTDAEAWSNLAAALVHSEPKQPTTRNEKQEKLSDEEEEEEFPLYTTPKYDPQQRQRDALKAFKRAATIKHTDHRIWDNVLTVAASLNPPMFVDIVTAQKRIIELRGTVDGEKCIDVEILDALVRHIITSDEQSKGYDPNAPGLARLVVELVDKDITPLITSSSRLWKVVARLNLWRKRPSRALECEEKAWRVVTAQPGWENGAEQGWNAVVDATIDLVDAYRSYGPMERTEGLGAGNGEVVAKDWKFKARSAVKGICGRGRESWEGTNGWVRLRESLEDLK
jgi:tetratricopeptide (TPR) repeat protein